MTTEIAVLNRLGVALATDSAVTITAGGRTKVFNTADKLFELSCDHAVAVMINGNMDYIGTPWELIIKDFREFAGNTDRDTIQQWLNDFIEFVDAYPLLEFDEEIAFVKQKIDDEVGLLMDLATNAYREKIFQQNSGANRIDIVDVFSTELDTELQFLQKLPVAEKLKTVDNDSIIAKYDPEMQESFNEILYPGILKDNIISKLRLL